MGADESTQEDINRRGRLARAPIVVKYVADGKIQYWVRTAGGGKFRVVRQIDSMICSCRRNGAGETLCEHLKAVVDYSAQETEREKYVELGLRRIAGKLEDLVQSGSTARPLDGWSCSITGIRRIGRLIVVTSRLTIGGVSREAIGSVPFTDEASILIAERASRAAAAEMFPHFRAGNYCRQGAEEHHRFRSRDNYE